MKFKQGWRYFNCQYCNKQWMETCRDHESPSSSRCPTDMCDANLYGGVMPYGSKKDITIQIDKAGKLVKEEVWLKIK